jgi:hypothetical protein
MDIKKSLATKEGRIKLLQEIVKEAAAMPQDKELNKLMEFCNVLVKAFTSPPQTKKGAFLPLQMQAPVQKELPKDDIKTAIAAVAKGTASDKETITADNLKKANDNDKD